MEQSLSYPFISFVAEVGGYVGLFLGYSMLSLADLAEKMAARFLRGNPMKKGVKNEMQGGGSPFYIFNC